MNCFRGKMSLPSLLVVSSRARKVRIIIMMTMVMAMMIVMTKMTMIN